MTPGGKALVGLSFTAGFALCLLLFAFDVLQPPPANARAERQLEFDAYRACLASAGRSGCKMTPQDFVRYYELKHALEGAGDLP